MKKKPTVKDAILFTLCLVALVLCFIFPQQIFDFVIGLFGRSR